MTLSVLDSDEVHDKLNPFSDSAQKKDQCRESNVSFDC